MTQPRVGIVVVSHSRPLAEAAVALAGQMVGGAAPPLEVAAGTADGGLGTDALAVAEALTGVAARLPADDAGAGVLVLMDLGSAVLSGELALELAGELPVPVRLSAAPLVEGLVAAVVQAGTGAGLDEVAAEAGGGLAAKQGQLGDAGMASDAGEPGEAAAGAGDKEPVVARVTVVNPHGLHARPTATLVELARGFDAAVRLDGADARSFMAVASLGAGQGRELEVTGTGAQAAEAVEAVVSLVASGFGEGTGEERAGDAGEDRVESRAEGTTEVPDEVGDEGRDGQVPQVRTPVPASATTRAGGLPAAPGIGIGPAWRFSDDLPPLPDEAAADPEGEAAALRSALDGVRESVRADARAVSAGGGGAAAVFEAHGLLLDDPALLDPALDAVWRGAPAAAAWWASVDTAAARLEGLADPYLRARAVDVRSVGRQVLRRLLGGSRAPRRAGVLLADDVAPDDVARLDPAQVTAILTAAGSATSHAAILARAAGIPMVVGAGSAVMRVAEGTVVALDGGTGEVEVDPAADRLAGWERRAGAVRAGREAVRARAHEPAVTRDGTTVLVEANVRSTADAARARDEGADGVGLLRTELLFLDRTTAPTEDEQLAEYAAVAGAMAGRRVTVRTLDIGGDKPVPYVRDLAEANPFLGVRGLRLALARRELLDPQLRAVARAAADHPLAVMVPMVTTVDEVRAAREALDAAVAAVGLGAPPPGLEFGIMVEVPAAALRAAHLAPLVDFLSIGTNDLTQYVLAAERGNAGVAVLADGLDPAVLRLVAEVCEAAVPHGVRVAVCGELAADSAAVPLLLGLGVRELSVGAGSVAGVKDAVRGVDLAAAAPLARDALGLASATEVRALVADH